MFNNIFDTFEILTFLKIIMHEFYFIWKSLKVMFMYTALICYC